MGIFLILSLFFILIGFLLLAGSYKNQRYFESKGIPYQGNGAVRMITNFLKGIGMLEDIAIQYKKFNKEKVRLVGSVDFGQTTLMIMDVELIKSILVKDFEHFADRRSFALPKKDIIFQKMLFTVKGETWKKLRTKLSPTFTTGKIKRMFSLFNESGEKLVKFVQGEMDSAPDGEIDLSDSYSKFTMDIIATAACAIDSKAFNQKEPSVFELMGKKLQLQFGGVQMLKLIVMLMSDKLTNLLGLSFLDPEMQEFFSTAIKSSIHHRIKNNERRDDFIQLMLEAREGKLKLEESELEAFEKDAIMKEADGESGKAAISAAELLDDDGIVANAVLFILAGFDTTQSLLLFAAYALALNQDVQDKLRAEVDNVLDENDGQLTYDSLNKMIYLDSVLNETLRYYPAVAGTDRACTKDYKVPGTSFVLKKGQAIVVPIYGIHHDPQYFPDPDKFDPERFSPENKGKINPYTFLPFGQGPRNCIGMRFALTEVKVAVSKLVHNFKIEPSKRTLIPMVYAKSNSLKPEGGMYLALNKIVRNEL